MQLSTAEACQRYHRMQPTACMVRERYCTALQHIRIVSPAAPQVSEMLPQLQPGSDYHVQPSLTQLAVMAREDPESLAHIANFTVGRPGIGSVHWLEEVDVRGVDVEGLVCLTKGGVEVHACMTRLLIDGWAHALSYMRQYAVSQLSATHLHPGSQLHVRVYSDMKSTVAWPSCGCCCPQVYLNDADKPPVGEGFNCAARVRL